MKSPAAGDLISFAIVRIPEVPAVSPGTFHITDLYRRPVSQIYQTAVFCLPAKIMGIF